MWGAAGGLGSLTVKLAVAQGISVVALDQAEGLRAYATASLGAQHYVATQGKSSAALAAEVARACGGGGSACAIVLAPAAGAYAGALAALRAGGVAVAVGLPPAGMPLDVAALVLSGKTLRGSLVGTRLDMQECLAFCAERGISVAAAEVPLAEAGAAMAALSAGKVQGRIVLRIAPDA